MGKNENVFQIDLNLFVKCRTKNFYLLFQKKLCKTMQMWIYKNWIEFTENDMTVCVNNQTGRFPNSHAFKVTRARTGN